MDTFQKHHSMVGNIFKGTFQSIYVMSNSSLESPGNMQI